MVVKAGKRFFYLLAFIAILTFVDYFLMSSRFESIARRQRGPKVGEKKKSRKLKLLKSLPNEVPRNVTEKEKQCLSLVSRAKTGLEWICSREPIKFDEDWIQNRFSSEEKRRMSKTGEKIFLDKNVLPRHETKHRKLEILIWKQVEVQFNFRFLYSYSDTYTNPWGPQCPVHNCKVTHDSSRYDTVSIVGNIALINNVAKLLLYSLTRLMLSFFTCTKPMAGRVSQKEEAGT